MKISFKRRYVEVRYLKELRQLQLCYASPTPFLFHRGEVFRIGGGVYERRYVINKPYQLLQPINDLLFPIVFRWKLRKLLKIQAKEIKEKGARLY